MSEMTEYVNADYHLISKEQVMLFFRFLSKHSLLILLVRQHHYLQTVKPLPARKGQTCLQHFTTEPVVLNVSTFCQL